MNKTQYLLDYDVILGENEECENYFKTHLTDRETAKKFECYMQLSYGEDNILSDVKIFDKYRSKAELLVAYNVRAKGAIGNFKWKHFDKNNTYNLRMNKKGMHFLGGEVPKNFQIPESNCLGSFQYIGFIDKTDPTFGWLPFDINLICPIYLDFDKIWLDYTNPNQPTIINKEEIDHLNSSYGSLKNDFGIIFKKHNFETEPITNRDSYDIGFSGIPEWMQWPDIPICPRNNKTMKFLCQLTYPFAELVDIQESNIIFEDEHDKEYFKSMNFWGDGDLYVFFEPDSKTACYFIQCT